MDTSGAVSRSGFSRRTFLAGSVATALASATTTSALTTSALTAAAATKAPTVASLTSTHPFYIAHRGGGRDWPAMTAYAYSQAVKQPGIKALEISVCLTADNVLVCSHDQTTTAMTGVPFTIRKETWHTLSRLMVLPTYTLNRRQPARAFTRFDDIVDRYIDDFDPFVEPKIDAAGDRLMERMDGLRQPQRVVWKQPINSRRFRVAKEKGFATWGYVLKEPAHTGANLARYAASDTIDMLGAFDSEADHLMADVVATADRNGKKTIAWEISSVAERTRALRLGCSGLMTSELVNVLRTPL